MAELESGFKGIRPSKQSRPQVAALTSGSAVIASEQRLNSLKAQHRKVRGVDMEIYGFHRAALQSPAQPICFSAKTVVDKADEKKDDNYHPYGAHVSAAFCLSVVREILNN